ncbi:hypothetical protein [Amycolatopsis sp. H20-H5]|uniref:hypothetical protein n=1 Tax=Amycolatopsis sp. H20-H5 TaxID=3046309 RepID=UPI002DB5D881|nr:hypothetical protein [Amycolatopsis sp. H20-H5]MEC3979388.1 hypothetical protein [Amycolatopsis sp. H20-H5]
MNRRFGAGLALLGAVVAGGLLGLLLVSQSGPGPDPVPGPEPPPPRTATSASSASPAAADVVAVDVVASALVGAITRHDSAAFGKLTCRPQSSAALGELQRKWDAAGQVTAGLSDSPQIGGESATVRVHVEGAGGRKDTPFPLRKQDGKWCVPG